MIVTDIIEYNKKKYKIYIDGEFAFVLYKGELAGYGIEKGEELSEGAYASVMEVVLPDRGRAYAMNLIEKRDYTGETLRMKLRSALYPEECIDGILDHMVSIGYVNDYRYAVNYIYSYKSRHGKKRIAMDLQRKGVDRDLFEKAWDDSFDASLSEEEKLKEQEEGIIKYINSKIGNKNIRNDEENDSEVDERQKKKIIAALMRKGYDYDIIRRVMMSFF